MRSRTPRFPVACLALLALIAGCGGGGGGAPPATPGPGTSGTPDAQTQAVLQDCLPTALQEAFEFLGVLQDLLDGNGSLAGLSIPAEGITYADEPDLSFLEIQLIYDPDGDLQPDGSALVVFQDDTGGPIQPFAPADLDALLNGTVDTLGSILPNLPADTHLLADYASHQGTLQNAGVDVTYTGGAPGVTDGAVSVTTPDCNAPLAWADIPWSGLQADLVSTFPSGAWDIVLDTAQDSVSGTLTMDGTRSAVAVVSRNGGAVETWNFDLLTGAATAP